MGTLRVLPTHDLPGVQALKFEGASQICSHYNDAFSIATLFRSESSISFHGKAHRATDGAVGLLEPDGIFRHLQMTAPYSYAPRSGPEPVTAAPTSVPLSIILLLELNLMKGSTGSAVG